MPNFRYSLRSLLRDPAFTLITVLTLAIGMGGNAGVFSIVNALLLNPYPFPKLDRLVLLRTTGTHVADQWNVAVGDFIELQNSSRSFEALSAYRYQFSNWNASGDVERIVGCAVSANFFETVGSRPLLGRTFTASEMEPGQDRAVVLSHDFWEQHLGSNPNALGESLQIDGRSVVIVGVMNKDFTYPVAAEWWVPLVLAPAEKIQRDPQAPHGSAFQVLGRLRPTVSTDQAQSEMQVFSGKLQRDYSTTHENSVLGIFPLRRYQENISGPPSLMAQTAAILVLLLACVNVMHLWLVRFMRRRRELAIRSALGASGWQLAVLFMSETVPLSVFAGFFALILAFFFTKLIRERMPPAITRWTAGWSSIHLDVSVLTVAVAVALILGVLFGLAAAWRSNLRNIYDALRTAGAQASSVHSKGRFGGILVALQIALAMVLLLSTVLMMQGLFHVADDYQMLQPTTALTLHLSLPEQHFTKNEQIAMFYKQFLQGVAALPGIESVGLMTNLPASWLNNPSTQFVYEGMVVSERNGAPSADIQSTSPDFMRALRLPLLRGRSFKEQDSDDAPLVALVSRSLAKRLASMGDSGKNAGAGDGGVLGHRIQIGPPNSMTPWITIVGVVEDVKQNWWDKKSGQVIYLPYLQAPFPNMDVVVRTLSEPASSIPSVRHVATSLESNVLIEAPRRMDVRISDSLAPLRILSILMVGFGSMALLLAAVGVYGVLSQSVQQRAQEFGIRLAIGAQPRDLLLLVLGRAWKQCLAGLAIGLPLAIIVGRLLASAVFGVSTFSLPGVLGIGVGLVVVALAAAYLPARRAMRVDPMSSLRP